VQAPVVLSAIAAGYYQTCALDTGGGAWCWGANESGQLGDGSTQDRDQPAMVAGGRTYSWLAAGDRFACGLSSGAAWCWGANRQGELGSTGGGSSHPLLVPGTSGLRLLAAASGASTVGGAAPYACGVTASGVTLCWGGPVRGLRAGGARPARLSTTVRAATVSGGPHHVCVLDRRGYAWCGGGNDAGQLGDGTTFDRDALVGVLGPES
jgi:alpha-tubulin suppressor-like RCC1 family protein